MALRLTEKEARRLGLIKREEPVPVLEPAVPRPRPEPPAPMLMSESTAEPIRPTYHSAPTFTSAVLWLSVGFLAGMAFGLAMR
jgi:hypothetical protein